MKHLVVLTGAGISAESGLATFRGQGGLWEGHRVEEVATPEAFFKNPALVLDFYNHRRRQLMSVIPNEAHNILKELESQFKVTIITQNVDDLHERSGSENILHLHGSLVRIKTPSNCCNKVWKEDIVVGDLCKHQEQWRPDIVWFGESVPMIEPAISICKQADIMLIIGTSLQVYPASTLMHYAPEKCDCFYIDPGENHIPTHINHIQSTASQGLKQIRNTLEALR